MLRKRRKTHHEINAGSMADIAFLMLVFFLLTSTLDRNFAFNRSLPPPDNTEEQSQADKRNILTISVDDKGQLAINGKSAEQKVIKEAVKNFILNPGDDKTLSEKQPKTVKQLGNVPVSLGIVEIKTDENTAYGAYFMVNDQVNKAFVEMKEEFAAKRFNAPYASLDEFRRSVVDECIPVQISEE